MHVVNHNIMFFYHNCVLIWMRIIGFCLRIIDKFGNIQLLMEINGIENFKIGTSLVLIHVPNPGIFSKLYEHNSQSGSIKYRKRQLLAWALS